MQTLISVLALLTTDMFQGDLTSAKLLLAAALVMSDRACTSCAILWG